jgi:hypothetical protein
VGLYPIIPEFNVCKTVHVLVPMATVINCLLGLISGEKNIVMNNLVIYMFNFMDDLIEDLGIIPWHQLLFIF